MTSWRNDFEQCFNLFQLYLMLHFDLISLSVNALNGGAIRPTCLLLMSWHTFFYVITYCLTTWRAFDVITNFEVMTFLWHGVRFDTILTFWHHDSLIFAMPYFCYHDAFPILFDLVYYGIMYFLQSWHTFLRYDAHLCCMTYALTHVLFESWNIFNIMTYFL